jgi:hypothetical protein
MAWILAVAFPAGAGKAQAPQARGAHGLRRHGEDSTVADAVIDVSRGVRYESLPWLEG